MPAQTLRHDRRQNSQRRKWKMMTFICATTVWSSAVLLPYNIYRFLVNVFGVLPKNVEARFIVTILLEINAIVNPVLALMINQQYRNQARRIIIFRRRRPTREFGLEGTLMQNQMICSANNLDLKDNGADWKHRRRKIPILVQQCEIEDAPKDVML